MKTNIEASRYQNSILSSRMTLGDSVNFINENIKNGVQILRFVKDGYNANREQMVWIDHLDLKRN